MRGAANGALQARNDDAMRRTLITLASVPRRTIMELMHGQLAGALPRTRRFRTEDTRQQGVQPLEEVLAILGDRSPQGCYNNHAQARGEADARGRRLVTISGFHAPTFSPSSQKRCCSLYLSGIPLSRLMAKAGEQKRATEGERRQYIVPDQLWWPYLRFKYILLHKLPVGKEYCEFFCRRADAH